MSTFPDAPRRPYPSIGQAFGIILIFFFLSVLGYFLLSIGKGRNENPTELTTIGSYILGMAGTFLILFYTAIKRRIDSFVSIKPAIYLILFVMTPALLILIESVITLIPMSDYWKQLLDSLQVTGFASLVTFTIIGPILEELVFRGIILDGFLKRYSPVKAILWSAIIFGIAHLNPWQFVTAFILGTLIGWLYFKTGSILPGIFIHIVNNTTGTVIDWLTDNKSVVPLRDQFHSQVTYWAIWAGCLVLVITGTYVLRVKYVNNTVTGRK